MRTYETLKRAFFVKFSSDCVPLQPSILTWGHPVQMGTLKRSAIFTNGPGGYKYHNSQTTSPTFLPFLASSALKSKKLITSPELACPMQATLDAGDSYSICVLSRQAGKNHVVQMWLLRQVPGTESVQKAAVVTSAANTVLRICLSAHVTWRSLCAFQTQTVPVSSCLHSR